jgi:hypothetical protein
MRREVAKEGHVFRFFIRNLIDGKPDGDLTQSPHLKWRQQGVGMVLWKGIPKCRLDLIVMERVGIPGSL